MGGRGEERERAAAPCLRCGVLIDRLSLRGVPGLEPPLELRHLPHPAPPSPGAVSGTTGTSHDLAASLKVIGVS